MSREFWERSRRYTPTPVAPAETRVRKFQPASPSKPARPRKGQTTGRTSVRLPFLSTPGLIALRCRTTQPVERPRLAAADRLCFSERPWRRQPSSALWIVPSPFGWTRTTGARQEQVEGTLRDVSWIRASPLAEMGTC